MFFVLCKSWITRGSMVRNIFFTVIVLLSFSLYAAHSISGSDYLLFQLGDPSVLPGSGWVNHADATQLLEWGRAKGLNLVEDMAPVANRRASFIAASSASLQVTGLKAHATYTLWIDFVKFRSEKNPGIYSKLHVYADGRQIDELVWGKLPPDTLYRIDLPLDLTYDGDVVITFKEYAMNYGYWGVWDMVLATGDLPDGSYFKGAAPSVSPEDSSVSDKGKVSDLKESSDDSRIVVDKTKKDIEKPATVTKKTPVKPKPAVRKPSSKTKPKSPSKKPTVSKPKPKDVLPKKPSVKTPSVTSPVEPIVPFVDEPIVDRPVIPDKPKSR